MSLIQQLLECKEELRNEIQFFEETKICHEAIINYLNTKIYNFKKQIESEKHE